MQTGPAPPNPAPFAASCAVVERMLPRLCEPDKAADAFAGSVIPASPAVIPRCLILYSLTWLHRAGLCLNMGNVAMCLLTYSWCGDKASML